MPRDGDDFTYNVTAVGKEYAADDEEQCPSDGCIRAAGHPDEHQRGAGGWDQQKADMGWLLYLLALALILGALAIGGGS